MSPLRVEAETPGDDWIYVGKIGPNDRPISISNNIKTLENPQSTDQITA